MYLPLGRFWSKIIAGLLIAIGFVLAPDTLTMGFPPMSDLLNIMMATPLSEMLDTSYIVALVLTYVVAFMLIGLGFLIYPYNTKRLIWGRIHAGIRFATGHTLLFIGLMILAVTIFICGEMFSDWVWNNLMVYAQEVRSIYGG